MKLSLEIKKLIRKEYKAFEDFMYAGKTKEQRDELAQFFTPPEISIKLIEELSDLEGNILDPTSGSGNLLAAAIIAGADVTKVYGNEYDQAMVELCRDRIKNIPDRLEKEDKEFADKLRGQLKNFEDWQIHQGNALIPDCLTEFGPEYDDTILKELLKRRNGLKGGWLANPNGYLKYKENQAKYGKEHADKLEEVASAEKAEYEDIWSD